MHKVYELLIFLVLTFPYKMKEKTNSYIFIISHAPDSVFYSWKKTIKLGGKGKGNQLFYASHFFLT